MDINEQEAKLLKRLREAKGALFLVYVDDVGRPKLLRRVERLERLEGGDAAKSG